MNSGLAGYDWTFESIAELLANYLEKKNIFLKFNNNHIYNWWPKNQSALIFSLWRVNELVENIIK